MDFLNKIFLFYDNILTSFPDKAQFLVALLLLFLIAWALWSFFHHGHWIFALIFLILFPGGWPALKHIGGAIWLVVKFLLIRIQINI